MQNAKDTFYEVLRNRLVSVNPYRTVVLRGVVRPGVLVEENELISATALADCFRLRWTESEMDASGAMPLVKMLCEIDYETAGTESDGGMDRGRMLAAMDGELQACVNPLPRTALKSNYAALAGGGTAVAMNTSAWWGELEMGKAVVKDDRIARTAVLSVMSYQEAGEL